MWGLALTGPLKHDKQRDRKAWQKTGHKNMTDDKKTDERDK